MACPVQRTRPPTRAPSHMQPRLGLLPWMVAMLHVRLFHPRLHLRRLLRRPELLFRLSLKLSSLPGMICSWCAPASCMYAYFAGDVCTLRGRFCNAYAWPLEGSISLCADCR